MDRSIRRYVEHVVSDYPDTKADVASMEVEIVECSLNHDDSGIRGGGVGSPTESKAINLMTNKYLIQLNRNLRAVAKATGADVMDNVSGCCGKTVEGVRDGLMAERQAEVAGADVIIVSCPMCFSMYDNFAGGKPVMHIVELVALASGDSSSLKFHKIPVPLNRA